MKVVAFIPIKLNSQRLPHKNTLPIAGHPLCWHVCNTLNQVKGIDEVYVFCSDREVEKYIPLETNVILRDPRLDKDEVKGFEIYADFIKAIDADVYVLAHTTSPFISVDSISNALTKVTDEGYDSAFSAKRIQTFAWYKGQTINYELNDVPRTQDIEPVWVETSAFYIFRKEIFTEQHRRIGNNPYIQETSDIESVDIDEREDYEMALRMIGDK